MQTHAPSVIFTGFLPWAEITDNPSWSQLEAADIQLPPPLQLLKLPLHVDWNLAWTQLEPNISPHTRAVVCFGLARQRSHISVERFAHNIQNQQSEFPDRKSPLSDFIDASAPAAYRSTLPEHELEHRLRGAGLPVEFSRDAGEYLCNFISFRLLQYTYTRRPDLVSGFIHVPPANCLRPEQWPVLFQTVADCVSKEVNRHL